MTRHELQFVREYQGAENMTRECRVVTVETADGYILARAQSPHDVAFCASRTASKAIGRAVSAAVFGDFRAAEAWETASAALEYARISPVDYH